MLISLINLYGVLEESQCLYHSLDKLYRAYMLVLMSRHFMVVAAIACCEQVELYLTWTPGTQDPWSPGLLEP